VISTKTKGQRSCINKKKKKAMVSQTKEIEAYDAEKKAQEDLFKLSQFRLQVAIDMDDEILKMIKHH
jgi:hypothetical protein